MNEILPHRRRVLYYETDKMGIVHHSNYIRYMEEGRLEYMRQAGLVYKDLESRGILMPVTGVSCRYRQSLVFDDWMSIVTTLTQFNGVRAAYRYEIYRASDGVCAATGTSEHCFLDLATRRPVSLKKAAPDFFDTWAQFFRAEQKKETKL